MKTNALEVIKSILLTELDIVTDTLVNALDGPDELHEHWLPRLAKVNKGLQFIEALGTSRVVRMDERQYQTLRALLAFCQDNDDFGNNPDNWPYDKSSRDTLVMRLDNIEKHGL